MITGLSLHYLYYCHRKLWLYSNGIRLENTSTIVEDGKIIHENTYTRRSDKLKNIDIGCGVIDYLDIKNKVIHETKRSSKNVDSTTIQLKWYMYILNDDKITGLIEVPTERKTIIVNLSNEDKKQIEKDIVSINNIVSDKIPKQSEIKKCKLCSYYEYCYC
jgi:CRISPR-associated exonuclease Cas4